MIFCFNKNFREFPKWSGNPNFLVFRNLCGSRLQDTKVNEFLQFWNFSKIFMKRKITFFEHRKIDSKNVIFRLIKIFENFQNGLGNQFFWFLESSLGVDYKIPKVWLKVPKTWTKILSQKNWPKKSKKLEANSIQCSQAVTHPSTNRAQYCLTLAIWNINLRLYKLRFIKSLEN